MLKKRVRIKECDAVCSYLHGHTGTITEITDSMFHVGRKIYRVTLDQEARPEGSTWPVIKTIGLEMEHFEETT